MGGQEFASIAPEAYLFGDMNDLNFLARIPGIVCIMNTTIDIIDVFYRNHSRYHF